MTLGRTQDAALGHLRNVHPQKWLNDFTRREGFRLLTSIPRHSSVRERGGGRERMEQ